MPSDNGHAQVLMFSRDGSAAPDPATREDHSSPALNMLILASLAATSWGLIAFISWAAI
jgi:hypothetical protein